MMRLRFTGIYTGGREAITLCGVTFTGREPATVDGEALRRLSNHPEFEPVHPLDHDGDGEKGGSLPRKRGRPKKEAE